ncbi:hypothetical protein BT96DRAFT_926934 [Gymnopus androsaceus JB14]|uniref:Uncharacterized protein n=1 Tax=Gymnopus androsaceus JB14 TaxID=1447944 RepID=A0A6A4GU59_9AGAR|nr:hypothetical protein BT96DRAFT_926934 [Gymnopus androsaceus JB14]
MAAIHPLPTRNKRSAPKWDSEFEEQFPTFFEEFKAVATRGCHENVDQVQGQGLGPLSRCFERCRIDNGGPL